MKNLGRREKYFIIGFTAIALLIVVTYMLFSYKSMDWLYNPTPKFTTMTYIIEIIALVVLPFLSYKKTK